MKSDQNVWEAEASFEVVQVVADPTRPRLPSTARTMMLLRMSARKASYQALRTISSRSASAAPACRTGTAYQHSPSTQQSTKPPHAACSWKLQVPKGKLVLRLGSM